MKRKQKPHKEELEEIQCEHGSDNVFADLGFENPEEELLKADLTAEIATIIKKKGLTQMQAAKVIGITQPRISTLLRGRTDLFSVEMLMRFLNALGQDIKLIIEPKPKTRKHAYSSVYQSSSRSQNAEIFFESGFVAGHEDKKLLSTNYKEKLTKQLRDKYDFKTEKDTR